MRRDHVAVGDGALDVEAQLGELVRKALHELDERLEPLVAPALYIAADELQPRADMARVHELCPQLLDGKTVGSGHFCQLEVPEQVNAMISRFLAVALPR